AVTKEDGKEGLSAAFHDLNDEKKNRPFQGDKVLVKRLLQTFSPSKHISQDFCARRYARQ
ncbi:hypothetical protein, partial [Acinetobacter baumannii]|uniref:hypothetical protein n=1 Tax=Acinetobacter baumannii TaxID=470 RepID=UPI001C0707CE